MALLPKSKAFDEWNGGTNEDNKKQDNDLFWYQSDRAFWILVHLNTPLVEEAIGDTDDRDNDDHHDAVHVENILNHRFCKQLRVSL